MSLDNGFRQLRINNPGRTTQMPLTIGGSRYADGITTDNVASFLDALFEQGDLVVVRPIETWVDERGKKVSDVKWRAQQVLHPGQVKSADGWRSWLAFAERERANLFFGVCPRFGGDNLYNAAWQIRVVRALWGDVDGCTPEEVLGRCRNADVPDPSILVNSANGAHPYWLLDEIYSINDVPPPPPVISEFVVQADGRRKRRPYYLDENGTKVYKMPQVSPKGENIQRTLAGIARAIGGDHTTDLARLLRLPGTLNRKDQRNGRPPVPCSLVECDTSRRYPIDRFREFLVAPTGKAQRAFSHGSAPLETPTADRILTPEDAALVDHLLRSHSRFSDLWRGDSSGYESASHADWAAACILAGCDLDSQRILNILWCSGLRREKWDQHSDYLEKTVAKAMDHVTQETSLPRPSDKASLPKSDSMGSAESTACPPAPPDVRDSIGGSDSGDDDENDEHFTELGNARQLVHYHGQDLRYCFAWKQWLVWDGRR